MGMHQGRGHVVKTWLKVLLFIIGAATLLLFITFPRGLHPERQVTESDVQELRESFPDFIKERIITEKQKGTLKSLSITSVEPKEDDVVHLSYVLKFDNLIDGEKAESAVEATAILHKQGINTWKVEKVFSQKETVDFNDGVLVSGKKGAETEP
jgi:hypothetical protein